MNNREQSIINLVINGQQAQTSLREVSGAVNALRSSLSNMRREDNPALYEERIRQLRQMSAAQAALRQEINSTGEEAKTFWQKLRGSALGVAAGNVISDIFSGGVGALKDLAKAVIQTYVEFEKFDIILTNTLGSKGASRRALNDLQKFAAETPFSLAELTESYVKLVNRGMTPTMDMLRSMGDLASSQGKSFDQLTEAVLDAVTGEFERLKEFGITASKNGDMVALSFKGITKDVKNTQEAINEAIMEFGKMDGVAGGMEKMSQSVGGQISNMGDNWDRVLVAMGNRTGGFIYDTTAAINVFLDYLANRFRTTEEEIQASADDYAGTALQSYNKMNASDKKATFEGTKLEIAELKKELNDYYELAKKTGEWDEERVKHFKARIAEEEALLDAINQQRVSEEKAAQIRADRERRDKEAAAKKAADKAAKEAEKAARELKTFKQNVKNVHDEVDAMIASASKGTAANLDAQLQVINNKYRKVVDHLRELSGSKYASASDRNALGKDIKDAGKLRDNELEGAKAEFSYNSIEKSINDDAQNQKNGNNNSNLTPEEKAQQEYEIEQKRLEDLFMVRQLFGMQTLDLETLLANGKIANDKRVHDAHMDYLKKQTKGEQDYQRFQQMVAAQKTEIAEEGLQLLSTVFGKSKGVMLAQLAFEKAIAIGRIIQQEGIEIAAYYAQSVLTFGPIVGPGVATGLATMAKIRAGLSIANVIASGVIQAANMSGSDSGGKKFANGGFAPEGASHSAGGLKLVNPYGLVLGEMEGGEPILSRATYANNRGLVDALMSSGGRQLNLNRIQDANYNRERRLSNLSFANDDRTAAAAAGASTADPASLAMLDQLVALTEAVRNQKVIFSNRTFEDSQARRLELKNEALA
jgi:hypothetical protein